MNKKMTEPRWYEACFTGKTNDQPYINWIKVRLADGRVVVLDRVTTLYNDPGKEQILDMSWEALYLWDGKVEDYAVDVNFNGAEVVFVYVEDDAPEEYDIDIQRVVLYGRDGAVELPIHLWNTDDPFGEEVA